MKEEEGEGILISRGRVCIGVRSRLKKCTMNLNNPLTDTDININND